MKQIISSILLASFIMIGLVLSNQATSLTEAMNQTSQHAAEAYQAEKFAEATQAYQELVTAGVKNSDIFYNLGNAYFKQGDIGRAIVNYRRAKLLSPRDGDIQTNLGMAEAQAKDQLDLNGESTINRIAEVSQNWVTLNEMALLALTLWFGLALLLFSLSQTESARGHEVVQYGAIIVGLLFVASALALGSRLYVEATQPAAVIIADKVDVSSGPGSQFVTQFTLHSGTEVHLLEQQGSWVRLTLPGDQMQGWVSKDTVEMVE
jgi:tetratricopeptide (TPR) repeat protein